MSHEPTDGALGYDELPYPSAPYPYSHCDHLAIVARLFGIAAADVRRCRVLEVGCADGANLVPMALTLGGSRFVGIDLSERQIAAGQATVDALGLTNIELRRQDLSEFALAGHTFDYIIAHGVYSWTSPPVRTRLLELCRACLADHGVAFISYNVYPGWQQQKALREWLLRTTRDAGDTAERLQKSRRLLGGLRKLLLERDAGGQRGLIDTIARLESWSDGYLRHDLLEDDNAPQFFADFVAHAEAHGLKFFAEADVASMVGGDLPSGVAEGAARLSRSPLAREQLLDLLTQRAFRQSLLCRAECAAQSQLDVEAVRSAYVVSTLRAASSDASGDRRTVRPMRFEARQGAFAIEVDEPLVAAALRRLQDAWPSGGWFAELIADDAATPAETIDAQRQSLANLLLAAFVQRAVELHAVAPAAAQIVGERPLASPLARRQAERGSLVTNLRHDVVRLDADQRAVLLLLDGSRDRAALSEAIHSIGREPSAPPARGVKEHLEWFLRAGLIPS